ncbi:MAG: hypothetical protein J5I92_10730 [Thiogranum sp.]|nr:hypothetical protein [Thiogranum sp.]
MSASVDHLPSIHEPHRALLDDLLRLKERILSGTAEEVADLLLGDTSAERASSILNLLHYVVMRREDLRPLQARLAVAGLSSLGRVEPHVLSTIDSVIDLLSLVVTGQSCTVPDTQETLSYEAGHLLLRKRTEDMFGAARANRSGYIMVTMPTEAADSFELVETLVATGMNAARINCAHDDETVWRRMIDNIKRAAKLHETDIRILMDLAGHKIRTGRIVPCKTKPGKPGLKFPRIRQNDWLVLCRKSASPEVYEQLFDTPVKAVVTCTCPEIIGQLRRNEPVWIDDGKIGALIKDSRGDALLLQVNRVGPMGTRLKENKGLNFPETQLDLPTLSRKDMRDLGFVSQHADMVGLSFTEKPEDVVYLQEQLAVRGAGDLPIIAKIETAHAVRRLPDILARSLARNIDLGIMIARGDLAVELGSVRMAEIQEEILWVCEAAHVPVIWATQVFESLAKNGVASRPEITDAASSVRAECVMLNKGPYIQHAVTILSDILCRMEAHQSKKISRLRALHW